MATRLVMANACRGNKQRIREGSCNEQEACKGSHNKIGDESCNGEKVCVAHHLVVWDHQCNHDKGYLDGKDKAGKEGDESDGASGNGNSSIVRDEDKNDENNNYDSEGR